MKRLLRKIVPKKIWYMLSIFKRIIIPNGAKNLKSINFIKNYENVIVLGNGPSLNNDLEQIADKVGTHDFVCVNNFCSSPYYKIFRPSMYIFLDGYFFVEKAHPEWIEQRRKTFNIINKETIWDMKIFLPAGADENILKKFIKNTKIEIIKINVFQTNHLNLYNTGYWGPGQCNVLIYAVYLSIWTKYKNIEIYGADLSFHKDIDVDQNDNSLIMIFKHFNKEDEIKKCMKNPERIIPFTMTEIMDTTMQTFQAHEILEKYAFSKNINIVNLSSYSLIDAYKRESSFIEQEEN